MIVDDLRSEPISDEVCRISARVRPQTSEALRLWWRLPARFAPEPLDGSPFVAAALTWALQHGEGLSADVPISPRMAENLPVIAERYGPQDGTPQPPIDVPPTAQPPPAHPLTGCFFGLGVDSWFAVLTALEDDPEDPPLTHFIFSPDLLSDTWPQEVRDAHARATREAAARMGCEVIQFETNLRRDLSSGQNRVTLACSALALGLKHTLVPSNTGQVGWPRHGVGSKHAMVDYRFSTERTEIAHFGDAIRVKKVARLARSPAALETLHVCGRKKVTSHDNCGRCEKCLRTMTALHVAGVLEHGPKFGAELLPTLIRKRGTLGHRGQWRDLLRALGDAEADRRLAAAIRLLIAQNDVIKVAEELEELSSNPAVGELAPKLPRASERAASHARGTYESIAPERWEARRPLGDRLRGALGRLRGGRAS